MEQSLVLKPGMTSSTEDSTTQSLPKVSLSNARRAGKHAKRCAELFESGTNLKRQDTALVEWSDVKLGPLLGQGSFASVYQVSLVNGSTKNNKVQKQEYYALKCLKPSIVEDDCRKSVLLNGATDLALESKLLQHLSHDNIIRLHGVKAGCILKSTCEPRGFFLLLDHLDSTLEQVIATWKRESKNKRRSTKFQFFSPTKRVAHKLVLWKRLQSSALGIARGLEYLHNNKVHHGDVKPRNIGFARDGTIKIFDFGLARETGPDGKHVLPERCASTPRYAAPEVLPNEQQGDSAGDVYSFAIILWEISSLKKPFEDIKKLQDFEREVVQGDVRPSLKYIPTKTLQQIVSSMWSHLPESRPTMSQVRQVLQDEIAAVLGHVDNNDDTQKSIESTGSITDDCSIQSQQGEDDVVLDQYNC